MKSRIVVVDMIVHQGEDKPATPVEVRFARFCGTDEHPYARYVTVGDVWKPVDTGWLSDVGVSYLLLHNREKPPQYDDPNAPPPVLLEVGTASSPGDMADADITRFAWVWPGECLKFCPSDSKSLRYRCVQQQCKVLINAFPR
jgi:hypothetical protein